MSVKSSGDILLSTSGATTKAGILVKTASGNDAVLLDSAAGNVSTLAAEAVKAQLGGVTLSAGKTVTLGDGGLQVAGVVALSGAAGPARPHRRPARC